VAGGGNRYRGGKKKSPADPGPGCDGAEEGLPKQGQFGGGEIPPAPRCQSFRVRHPRESPYPFATIALVDQPQMRWPCGLFLLRRRRPFGCKTELPQRSGTDHVANRLRSATAKNHGLFFSDKSY